MGDAVIDMENSAAAEQVPLNEETRSDRFKQAANKVISKSKPGDRLATTVQMATAAAAARANINENTPPQSIHGSSVAGTRLNSFSREKKKTKKEQIQYYYNKFLVAVSHSINIIKAVMMRVVFSLHSLIAIVYVFLVKKDEWYFVNVLGVVFMMIELFVTIIKRKGREPRWFFPCFFIYICTMIPPIWFIELTRINQANMRRRSNDSESLDPFENLLDLGETLLEKNDLIGGLKNNKIDMQQFDISTIAVSLEISLLLLVIMGRWFLPKGNISRSTLSQLLLVYMSLASDIVDLLSLLNETQVQESSVMTCFTLAIFSWSLFQFSLNLVVTRGRSFQSTAMGDVDNTEVEDDEYAVEFDHQASDEKRFLETLNKYARDAKHSQMATNKKAAAAASSSKCKCMPSCIRFDMLDSEVWSILITLLFQDGPFLALRLTAVIEFNVRTFVTMFFTFKNGIILFLQIYRLSAICSEAKHNQNDPYTHNKADALASLNMAASYLDKFLLLSYAQSFMVNTSNGKNGAAASSSLKNSNKIGSSVALASAEEAEKKLLNLSPVLLRSTLTRSHTYAIVLTPSYNLTATCCQCECHFKNVANNYA